MEARMRKRLKMHGAETSDDAYMVHSYTQSASCPASKPLPKENPPCYAHGHTPIK